MNQAQTKQTNDNYLRSKMSQETYILQIKDGNDSEKAYYNVHVFGMKVSKSNVI